MIHAFVAKCESRNYANHCHRTSLSIHLHLSPSLSLVSLGRANFHKRHEAPNFQKKTFHFGQQIFSFCLPFFSLFPLLFLSDWRQHNFLIFISYRRETHWKSVASLIFSFRCFFPEFDVLFDNISNVSVCVCMCMCVFYYIFKWFDGFISRVRSVCSCNLSRLSLLNWINLPPLELGEIWNMIW